MVDGWRKALASAGGDVSRAVPGHDPEVRMRYPVVSGSNGETVELHKPPSSTNRRSS